VFFSYTPGKGSGAFQYSQPAQMLDSSTLNGIQRKDSPFFGNNYPFRFVHPSEYSDEVAKAGLMTQYLEVVTRTYRDRDELFEHVVLEAVK